MAKKKNYKSNIPVPGSAPWMRKKQVNAINRSNKEQAALIREYELVEKAVNMMSAYLGM